MWYIKIHMVNLNEDITHETGAHRRAGMEGEI